MALHEQCLGATDEWYTPPHVFRAMGCAFDLDVSSPGKAIVPWIPAVNIFTKADDALSKEWKGFVWMNPPFGGRNGLVPWLEKFCRHGDGVCLVPDRTSAPWWQEYAPRMDLILFVTPKIKFIGADGQPGKAPAQGTSLMAMGDRGRWALQNAAKEQLGFLTRPASAAVP